MSRPLRAVLAAAVTALAAAAPAGAFLPPVQGSAVGDGVPLKAYASITPAVHLFGDAVTARVAVVADTRWVTVSRLRVTADFEPYRPIRPPTILGSGNGRFRQVTWTWTLRCVTSPCVPRTPPSDRYHVFHFPPARIDYLSPGGKPAYGITAAFPAVEALSQVSPGVVTFLARHNALKWQYRLAPVAAPSYRIPPEALFWVALGLGIVLAATGLTLLGRWALALRPRPAARAPEAAATALERALALFLWARDHGDDTLQRKALERVADELAPGERDLAEQAHAIAWSPEAPGDEVESLSERARGGTRRDSPAAEERA